MIRRFKIEDLIYQDTSGVTFRALDSETGAAVALRRFFPFGPEGGGLQPDEQTAYNIALERLAGISHPSLRAVVAGGCDPVDGIPFIATEWVEGEPLHLVMNEEPVPAETAAKLVTQALEVCELLSHVLAEESVWIDTEITSIVVGSQKSGREFTFWISPLKWLGGGGESRGLKAIVQLTEEVMGWQGQAPNDQAGKGLGIWLKWLRMAAETTTLKEARESLAAAIGVEPPPPVKAVVATATRPMSRSAKAVRPVKKRKSKAPVFSALILLCVIAGGVGWWWVNRDHSLLDAELADVKKPAPAPVVEEQMKPAKEPAKETESPAIPEPAPSEPVKTPEPRLSDEELRNRANRLAAEMSAEKESSSKEAAADVEKQKADAEKRGAYLPRDVAALLANDGKEVTLEGELKDFDESGKNGTGEWLYLVFSKQKPLNARGKIIKSTAPVELGREALAPLIGKRIRITGVVSAQSMRSDKRPLIEIKSRSAITEVP